MSNYGFRAWDAAHALQIEESGRYGRVAGIFDITAANSTVASGFWTGSFNDNIFLTGTPFWAMDYIYSTTPRKPVLAVSISVSGSTLSWSVNRNITPAPNVITVRLLYGVYS